jgi:hypothetical protein
VRVSCGNIVPQSPITLIKSPPHGHETHEEPESGISTFPLPACAKLLENIKVL